MLKPIVAAKNAVAMPGVPPMQPADVVSTTASIESRM